MKSNNKIKVTNQPGNNIFGISVIANETYLKRVKVHGGLDPDDKTLILF